MKAVREVVKSLASPREGRAEGRTPSEKYHLPSGSGWAPSIPRGCLLLRQRGKGTNLQKRQEADTGRKGDQERNKGERAAGRGRRTEEWQSVAELAVR